MERYYSVEVSRGLRAVNILYKESVIRHFTYCFVKNFIQHKPSSEDAELKLYDGRMLAQNGWFVLRSVFPKGKTGKVVT
ncbi:MAG: hypothetical protein II431_12320, partial [Prevotella sp.]|nr:hypothetical protein [Prevotella sp.]